MPDGLSVRAGRVAITPSRPGPLAGYVARGDRVSAGTLDELEANLVVLSGPGSDLGSGSGTGGSVAWLALDAIAVTTELAARLRTVVERHLGPAVTVLACASHTHSGPLGWVGAIHPGIPGAVDEADRAELVARIDGLARAVASAEPVGVRPRFSRTRTSGVAANRTSRDLPADGSVGVVELRADDGSPAGMLFDFACHPTVLGADSLGWSADWVGAARTTVRAATRPGLPIAFLQGAAGDVSTRFTRRAQSRAEAIRLGETVGAAVVSMTVSAAGGREPELRADVLDSRQVCCRIPRRGLPALAEADRRYAIAAAALAELPADVEPATERLARTEAEGAMVQRALAASGAPAWMELPITAVRLGDVAWLHLPVEPFTSIGRRIVEASPFRHTRVVGYTDGYDGYLTDASARTRQTYEAMSSWFDEAGERAIIAAATDLLHDLWNRQSDCSRWRSDA
ncbi:hypothetical protein [Flindersiella endophytica]